jgi:GcrA cell cycle regulator
MTWTPERTTLISELWREGWTADRIASELGGGITRNAVIGKLSRLGLSDDDRPKPSKQIKSKKIETSRQRATSHKTPEPNSTQPAPKEECTTVSIPVLATTSALPVRNSSPPKSRRLTLEKLDDGQCKYVTDTSHGKDFFCGTPTGSPRKVYCPFHTNMCITRPPPHRKKERLNTDKRLCI